MGIVLLLACACSSFEIRHQRSIHRLAEELASPDRDVATRAAHRLMNIEDAVEVLASLEGDARRYHGRPLGDRNAAMLIWRADDGAKIPTVEVVALYIINAIYFQDREFAQSAFLTDISEAPVDRDAVNSPERLRMAWSAVARWRDELKKRGMKSLREAGEEPFKTSAVRFW